MQYEYNPHDQLEINLSAACEVVVYATNDNSLVVDVEGDDADKVNVNFNGRTLEIKHEGHNSGGISIGNVVMNGGDSWTNIGRGVVMSGISMGQNTVISGNNIHISGGSGSVYVNGKRIDLDEAGENYTPTKVSVYVPEGLETSLDAEITGTGMLRSNVYFEEAYINSQGHTGVSLSTASLQAQVSGSGDLDASIYGGDLNVTISGSADVRVNGNMSRATVQVSGSGDVYTCGTCQGNYSASVSGSGDIRHQGQVLGKVRKSVAGSGSVRVG